MKTFAFTPPIFSQELRSPNLKLYELDADTLSLTNLAGDTWKNLKMGALELTSTLTMPNNTAIQMKRTGGDLSAQNIMYLDASNRVFLTSPLGVLWLNYSTARDVQLWGSGAGHLQSLNLLGTDAATGAGNVQNSPYLKWTAYYRDGANTNTAWPYTIQNQMTTGGATPASSVVHSINSVTVLTLTNTNGTPSGQFHGLLQFAGQAINGLSYITGDQSSGLIIYPSITTLDARGITVKTGNLAGDTWVTRLTLTGGATTAVATWAAVAHEGFKSGDLSVSNATEGYTGALNIKTARQVVALTGASTSTTINIPAGAMLLGASFNVDTAVVTSSATNTWDADFTGGSTTNLVVAGKAGAQNTKANKLIVPEVATAETNIEFDAPGAETFSSGAIEVVAYYIDQTSLANA